MSSFVSRFKKYGRGSAGQANGPTELQATGHSTGIDAADEVDSKNIKDPNVTVLGDDLEKDAAASLDDDSELRDIPKIVRDTVSLEDDPTALCLTFRYWFLSVLFVIPGAFLSQMSHFRTTSAPYSVFFVQIACHYVGHFLAKVLPAKRITIPFTNIGFSLNPGPWSIKEHTLITITAASGATYNLGFTPIVLAELWYDEVINPAVTIFFMLSIVFAGYAMAALARQVLLYDPIYVWPKALMQANLFETFRKSSEDSSLAKRQMKVFFFCLIGMILWQFLPEYVFPMTSSLAFLCWVAPRSATANFVGAGLGGMGFLNLSLDWSNITSDVMLMPFWTQTVVFAGFVVNCWFLIPWAKWGNLGSFKSGLMSTGLMMGNGTTYPVTSLLQKSHGEITLNQTAYARYGPIYMGTQVAWGTFASYAAYISAFTWIATFGYPNIRSAVDKILERRRKSKVASINHEYNDRLNIIMRSYKEVPLWWYGVLFLCAFISMIVILAKGYMYMPIWIYIIGLLFGATSVVPLGWLYAISNFQLPTGDFNELMYGYMINSVNGHKHPAGASVYGAVAGDAWYRAQYMLQDQKIGHYMHIPPRLVFMSQIFGELMGVPINYAVMRWVMKTKGEFITGAKTDPLHQWTGQSVSRSNTIAVQYVLVGPARLFKEHLYSPLPWAFLVGAGLPLVLYALHRAFPRAKFNLWNVTIFFSSLGTFYGNVSTGYFSSFIAGFVVMYWIYRRKFQLWSRYNYLVAAAFDAGFNFNMLLIFLFFSVGKTVTMPEWWGNRSESAERCFALD